ncbi:DUF6507 family protein [Streptomyces sp. NPDC015184]|uniref:DUF6507 family protein n=1 Tax=Streptomyces sp. NPDC015184 TaxID=3364946 RepID=UPI003700E269
MSNRPIDHSSPAARTRRAPSAGHPTGGRGPGVPHPAPSRPGRARTGPPSGTGNSRPARSSPKRAPTAPRATGECLRGRDQDFRSMAERTEASVLGAVEATGAYCRGDLEAAEHAQRAARAVRLDLLKDGEGR